MAKFSAMVDLAKDPQEVKEEVAEMTSQPSPAAMRVPVYPYGMCLSMNEDVLEKLDLDGDLPEVGDMIHVVAMGKVTSVSQNEQEQPDGTKKMCKRVEIQITHMASIEDEDEEAAQKQRQIRFYGAGGEAT